ncbi:hypothetical protein M5K25_006310 [Dendrobium thyrsiflorum]|uniref:Uncharacterized protein n=1 Tax=Dendrobium thyrsiflorum TaxID=117978 RepID=A0ABD0VBA9_DENTH
MYAFKCRNDKEHDPWSAVTPCLRRWSGGTPVLSSGPAEVRHQVVVRCNTGPLAVVRRNSGVRRWSGGTPASGGGPTELRRQVVVQRKSDVKWWSGGTTASGGDPVKLWRQWLRSSSVTDLQPRGEEWEAATCGGSMSWIARRRGGLSRHGQRDGGAIAYGGRPWRRRGNPAASCGTIDHAIDSPGYVVP